jgi:hypothetical protein
MLAEKINARTRGTEQVRPYFADELRTLNAAIGRSLTKVTDGSTRVHLLDVRTEIAKALDPRSASAAGAPAGRPAQRNVDPDSRDPDSAIDCWPASPPADQQEP